MSASASFISSIDSVAVVLREDVVAPVLEHLEVDEVLVHRGELGGEDLVQQLGDLSVALHRPRLPATRRASTSSRVAALCSSSSSAGQQPPHSAPAPQRVANSSMVEAPRATSPSMVRSVTARQWHTYTPPG